MLCICIYDCRYKQENISPGNSITSLDDVTSDKYQCVVFEDYRSYLNLEAGSRSVVDGYLKQYGVGLVAFIPVDSEVGDLELLRGYPLRVHNNISVKVPAQSTQQH